MVEKERKADADFSGIKVKVVKVKVSYPTEEKAKVKLLKVLKVSEVRKANHSS